MWASIGVGESKVGWMDKVIGLHVSFLLAQANGWACVDFGCSHPIDGLFWNLPIYLLGFFSKYECWVIDLTMSLYQFILFELPLASLYHMVSYYYEMWKTIHMTNFFIKKLFDKHANNLFQFL